MLLFELGATKVSENAEDNFTLNIDGVTEEGESASLSITHQL